MFAEAEEKEEQFDWKIRKLDEELRYDKMTRCKDEREGGQKDKVNRM
jgi:hypothetical protein